MPNPLSIRRIRVRRRARRAPRPMAVLANRRRQRLQLIRTRACGLQALFPLAFLALHHLAGVTLDSATSSISNDWDTERDKRKSPCPLSHPGQSALPSHCHHSKRGREECPCLSPAIRTHRVSNLQSLRLTDNSEESASSFAFSKYFIASLCSPMRAVVHDTREK